MTKKANTDRLATIEMFSDDETRRIYLDCKGYPTKKGATQIQLNLRSAGRLVKNLNLLIAELKKR